MAINKAEQDLPKRLVNDVSQLKRDMQQFKTAQPLGSDVLKVQLVPTDGFLEGGPLHLIADSFGSFFVSLSPTNEVLTLWNFAFTIYVDGDTNDLSVPTGTTATTAQKRVHINYWHDWANSSDTTNGRTFFVRLYNADTVAHDYYIKMRAYLPAAPGTA